MLLSCVQAREKLLRYFRSAPIARKASAHSSRIVRIREEGVARFDLRDPYHLAIALTWPQFLGALLECAARQLCRSFLF
jgi:hypothetical protein